MADEVLQYLESLKLYEAKREAVSRIFEPIHQVSNGTAYHLAKFLNINFGIPIPSNDTALSRRVSANDYRIDSTRWPDFNTINNSISEWHRAHVETNEAWKRIPDADRTGLRAPPSRMELRH
jgi:hypothetical protein